MPKDLSAPDDVKAYNPALCRQLHKSMDEKQGLLEHRMEGYERKLAEVLEATEEKTAACKTDVLERMKLKDDLVQVINDTRQKSMIEALNKIKLDIESLSAWKNYLAGGIALAMFLTPIFTAVILKLLTK